MFWAVKIGRTGSPPNAADRFKIFANFTEHIELVKTATMPRVPRAPQNESQRHDPLAEEYAPTYPFKQKSSHNTRKSRSDGDEDQEQDNQVIETKASRKILRIGQELADEEDGQSRRNYDAPQPNPAFSFDARFGGDVESEEEIGEYEEWEDEKDAIEAEVQATSLSFSS